MYIYFIQFRYGNHLCVLCKLLLFFFVWADKTFIQIRVTSSEWKDGKSFRFSIREQKQNRKTEEPTEIKSYNFKYMTPFSYLALLYRFLYNTVYTSNTTLLHASSLSFFISTNASYYNAYVYLFQFSALLKSVDFI